jgi:hypothetical protein
VPDTQVGRFSRGRAASWGRVPYPTLYRRVESVPGAQVGRFSRPLFDYTAAAARLDLGLTSPQAQWLADGGAAGGGGGAGPGAAGAHNSVDAWLADGGGEPDEGGLLGRAPLLKHRHAAAAL